MYNDTTGTHYSQGSLLAFTHLCFVTSALEAVLRSLVFTCLPQMNHPWLLLDPRQKSSSKQDELRVPAATAARLTL